VAAISIERGVVILTAGLARLGAAPSRQRIRRTRAPILVGDVARPEPQAGWTRARDKARTGGPRV